MPRRPAISLGGAHERAALKREGVRPVESRRLIEGDPYLLSIQERMYRRLLAPSSGELGAVVEVGSGPGLVESCDPTVIRVDLDIGPHVDVVADATCLPFKTSSVRSVICKDAVHHIRDIPAFLRDCHRVLVAGGTVVVSEPNDGLLAQFVYRALHREPFSLRDDPVNQDRRFQVTGNQALPAILRRMYLRGEAPLGGLFDFSDLGVDLGLSFLLSGGIFSRTRIPARVLLALDAFESRLLMRSTALTQLWKLTKTSEPLA